MEQLKSKPDYGTDGSPLSLIWAAVVYSGSQPWLMFSPGTWQKSSQAFFPWVVCAELAGGLMFFYVNSASFAPGPDASLVSWQGNETVLDVGTGRGLLMIGAAKKLTTGKASALTFGVLGTCRTTPIKTP